MKMLFKEIGEEGKMVETFDISKDGGLRGSLGGVSAPDARRALLFQ